MTWILQILGGWWIDVIGLLGSYLWYVASVKYGVFKDEEERQDGWRAAGMGGILVFFFLLADYVRLSGRFK